MRLYVIRVQRLHGRSLYLSLKWLDATSVVFGQRDALHFRSRAFAVAVLKLWREQNPTFDSALIRLKPRATAAGGAK